MTPLLMPKQTDWVSPSLQWEYFCLSYPIPSEFGQWATEHRLHARGSDFSAALNRRRGSGGGTSILRRLWGGGASDQEADLYQAAHVWIMKHKDRPAAVLLWEQANEKHPLNKQCAGRVNVWTAPELRGQGIAQQLFDVAYPIFLSQCPQDNDMFLRGGEVTAAIVRKYWKAPMTGSLEPMGDTPFPSRRVSFK